MVRPTTRAFAMEVEHTALGMRSRPRSRFAQTLRIARAALAPGLVLRVKVKFQVSEERAYHDRILVLCGDNDEEQATVRITQICLLLPPTLAFVQVSLHASPPGPDIQFDSYAHFGPVVGGSVATKYVQFRNMGQSLLAPHAGARARFSSDVCARRTQATALAISRSCSTRRTRRSP